MTPDGTPRRPALDAATARRRFLTLTFLRWLPVGLVAPVLVLVAVNRGLGLDQVGLVIAAQGFVVLVLELPTGGLADRLGRRPVLLAATAIGLVSLAIYLVAASVLVFAIATALQGAYRALDSGPLDAWYVDSAQAADPDVDLEAVLSRAGLLTGLAIAAGAATAAVLQAVLPATGDAHALTAPLNAPLVLALLAKVVEGVAIARLLEEPAIGRGARLARVRGAVREVPTVIRTSLALVRRRVQLRALLGAEALWGFAMLAVEVFWQPRLEHLLGVSESPVFGGTVIAMWAAAGLGAALAPRVTVWLGSATRAAGVLRALHGLVLVGLAASGHVVLAIAGLATVQAFHGATVPLHNALLHRNVAASERATILSVNSLSGQAAGAVGSLVFGALAASVGIPVVWLVAAGVLVLSAPLYRWAASDTAPSSPPPGSEPPVAPALVPADG